MTKTYGITSSQLTEIIQVDIKSLSFKRFRWIYIRTKVRSFKVIHLKSRLLYMKIVMIRLESTLAFEKLAIFGSGQTP